MSKASSQEYRKTKMLTEPIPKIITSMAVPSIIAFLINSIYSMADTYFVSGLGINATAAVSVNSSLDQIIMMAGSLLAVGANSYIARLLGAKEEKKASQVLSTAFFLAIMFGVVVMIFGTIFMVPMVRLLGATPTCEQYSIQYATYILLAAPFMAASFVMNQCLRAEGSAMLSMIGMGFGGILNCILDPIFIMGLNLGVAGASIATAISKLVSFSILIFPYLTHRSILRISVKNYPSHSGHHVADYQSGFLLHVPFRTGCGVGHHAEQHRRADLRRGFGWRGCFHPCHDVPLRHYSGLWHRLPAGGWFLLGRQTV